MECSERVAIFNSFVYLQIQKKNLDSATKEITSCLDGKTRRSKIKHVIEKIIVPINEPGQPGHWSLCIVDITALSLKYYCPLGIYRSDILKTMKSFLDPLLPAPTKSLTLMKIDGPVQDNSYDCGVFVCTYAKAIMSENLETIDDIRPENIEKIRNIMAQELISKKIIKVSYTSSQFGRRIKPPRKFND